MPHGVRTTCSLEFWQILTKEDEFAVRKNYQKILKRCFYDDLVQTRAILGLTQSQMAARLVMDDRSYIDLDHGKTLCSSLTLALYLSDACLDPMRFLWNFRREIERESAISDAGRLSTPINDAMSYRLPLSIKEKYVLANHDSYPICPRCNISLDREYVQYCDRCGQHLDWRDYNKATICRTPKNVELVFK